MVVLQIMVDCPVIKWSVIPAMKWLAVQYSNGIQPLLDHLNTEPVRYLDPHCIFNYIVLMLCSINQRVLNPAFFLFLYP